VQEAVLCVGYVAHASSLYAAHTLGTVDLYDGVDPLGASGIGAFDIMANPYGQVRSRALADL
jgi:hypothetical protein